MLLSLDLRVAVLRLSEIIGMDGNVTSYIRSLSVGLSQKGLLLLKSVVCYLGSKMSRLF